MTLYPKFIYDKEVKSEDAFLNKELIGRKRKYSGKYSAGPKRPNKPKEGKKNLNNEENKEEDEYCISNCFYRRKYKEEKEHEMICCDACANWYHIKCIGMTLMEFEYFTHAAETENWHCGDCKNSLQNKIES